MRGEIFGALTNHKAHKQTHRLKHSIIDISTEIELALANKDTLKKEVFSKARKSGLLH